MKVQSASQAGPSNIFGQKTAQALLHLSAFAAGRDTFPALRLQVRLHQPPAQEEEG